MKKKLLVLLLALVLILGVTMITSAAEESTTSGHSHCVCGGNLTDPVAIAQHGDCTETTEWIAMTAANMKSGGLVEEGSVNTKCIKFKESGNYYLTESVKLDAPLEIEPDQEITICLNGNVMYCNWKYPLIYSQGGVLNICDCTGKGYLKNANSTGPAQGGVLYLYTEHAGSAGTVVNMYGGTIKESKASSYGGNVRIHDEKAAVKAEFNLYGGTISGGSAKRGGNVFLYTNKISPEYAVLNIYGGSIVNGKVSGTGDFNNRGGNIYALKGEVHMYSGAVTGGSYQTDTTANAEPFGADICIGKNSGAILELNGKVSVGEVALGGGKSATIVLGENFETEQPINLQIATGFAYRYLVSNANESHLNDFVYVGTNMPDYAMALNSEGYLIMKKVDTELGHCYCGGAAANVDGHTCDKSVAWEAWDGTTELVSGGRYHLTDTDGDGIVTISNTIELTDKTVSICLDGLQLNAETQLFLLSGAAQLNICDCKGTGVINGAEITDTYGSVVYINEGCTFQLFGGTISGGRAVKSTKETCGGNILCAGTANLYGGTVTEGFANKYGGNIYVSSTGVLNLAGATVSNGTVNTDASGTYGGNVYVAAKGQATMSGGSLDKGAARAGGSVYVVGSFSMSGGTISGGKAVATGGNFRVDGENASLQITGGTIQNGESGSGQGANIFIRSTVTEPISIANATISGGVSGDNGANIYAGNENTLTITNCIITNGQTKGNGGNIYIASPEAILTNCTISGGAAAERGGNIYALGIDLTLDNCQITDGAILGVYDEAGNLTDKEPYGYNIFFNNSSDAAISLTVNGGTISGAGQGNLAAKGFNIFPTGKTIHITFSGDLTIDSLHMGTNRQITVQDLAETASIGLSSQTVPALFAPNAQAYLENFYSTNEDNMVIATDEGLVFTTAKPYWAYTASGAVIDGYATLDEAAAATDCAYVRLNRDYDAQGETFMGTVYLDLNGFDLTGLNLVGTIYGADSKTANYSSTSYGKLNVTLDEGGSIAPYRTFENGLEGFYLTLMDGEAYTFHKIAVEITHLSLDTTTAGFGYKAKFQMNEAGAALLADQMVSYGFHMGVAGGEMKTFELTGGKTEFTLRLKNILTEGGDKNAEYALMDIIAIPFVKINVGQENPLEITGESQTQNLKGCAKAVEQVVLYNSNSLTTSQIFAFQEFCQKYADIIEPFQKEEAVLESGDKIIFFGNSLTFYGRCVMEASNDVLDQTSTKRTNDQGYFYQICKANGLDVSVTNYTFGNHSLKSFYSGNCQANRGHDGANHLEHLTDFDYDYVVFQEGTSSSVTDLLGECKLLMDMFRSGNPNVQFVYLVHHRAHQNNLAYLSSVKQLEEVGFIVVDWGKLVADAINNESIPGGTMTYNKWSFIVNKSSSDGYHENILSGYITAQMLYCALTGESAVGQDYSFWNDTTVNSRFDNDEYMEKYYANQTEDTKTNFVEIFNSSEDMLALQVLMDQYLAEKAYLEY